MGKVRFESGILAAKWILLVCLILHGRAAWAAPCDPSYASCGCIDGHSHVVIGQDGHYDNGDGWHCDCDTGFIGVSTSYGAACAPITTDGLPDTGRDTNIGANDGGGANNGSPECQQCIAEVHQCRNDAAADAGRCQTAN